MSPQQVFSVANAVALVAWIMLAVLPGRPWVTRIITTKIVPSLLAVLYAAIVVSQFGRTRGGFSTLASVGMLFSNPWLLLAGWVHYLAFDLLVGSWELQDAREHGIPHGMVVPCLALTFLFGPAGWLLYTILRSIRRTGSNFALKG
jgi:ABA DEFICIENT 4-like